MPEIVINFSLRVDDTGNQTDSNSVVLQAMSEIEKFLDNPDINKDAVLRETLTAKLRAILVEETERSSEEWFKYGFHVGHLHSYNEFLKTNKVPERLNRRLSRGFPDKTEPTKFEVKSTAYDVKNPPKWKLDRIEKAKKARAQAESSISVEAKVTVTRRGKVI